MSGNPSSKANPPITSATLHRAAILEATIEVVAERGLAGATVGLVTRRAGVSRRTFDELFGTLDGCFAAVMDAGARQVAAVVRDAFRSETVWTDGIRSALAALLVLFESDAARSRVWHVETLAAGQSALERRQRHLSALRAQIVEHWHPADPDGIAVASDGVIAALLGVLHTRLITPTDGPILTLLGPLMGLVVAPFVDPDAQAREVARSERLAHEVLAGHPPASLRRVLSGQRERLLAPRPLPLPRSAHMQRCLLFLARSPGASNGEVAAALGIAHPPQVSKVLNQLGERGLIAKRSHGLGKRNEWTLTALGEAMVDLG